MHRGSVFQRESEDVPRLADRPLVAGAVSRFAHGRRDLAGRHPHVVSDQPRERGRETREKFAALAQERSRRRGGGRNRLRQHAPRLVRYRRSQCGLRPRLPGARRGARDDRSGRLPRPREFGRGGTALRRDDRRAGRFHSDDRPSATRGLPRHGALLGRRIRNLAPRGGRAVLRPGRAAHRVGSRPALSLQRYTGSARRPQRPPLAHRRGADRDDRFSCAGYASGRAREDGDSRDSGLRVRRRPEPRGDSLPPRGARRLDGRRRAIVSPKALAEHAVSPVVIVHFDIDAFYAAVEIRDDPALRGKPIAVAGSSRRAVVLTASYEARPYGVRSAMPLFKARALDEAFVDIDAADTETVVAFAQRVRERVRNEIGITVSAGVASGKMIAKIASDTCKPDGLAVVPRGTEAAFLAPLPVGRLWGIGPKAQARLAAIGVQRIGEFAALDDRRLFELFGRTGKMLRELARGNDDRRVGNERDAVSVSTEETFEFDVRKHAELLAVLREQSVEIVERLRRHGVRGTTVGVKLKRSDFKITSRQMRLAEPTADPEAIYRAAARCLARAHEDGVPVRLLGIRIGDLTADATEQLSLW